MKRLIIISIAAVVLMVLGIPLLINWYTGPPEESSALQVKVYRHDTGKIEKMSMEEYVTGVVAAEMPARFPEEALKAQAVSARTYVLKRMRAGGVVNDLHPEADVCDDHTHAQAFLSREEMKDKWGFINYYRFYYKIRRAAGDTSDMVITYNGRMIDPVYHSTCGGRTEDSGAVWKYAVPYLKSVACPCGENPEAVETIKFTIPEMEKALRLDMSAVPVSTGSCPVQVTERTGTGRASQVEVAGVELPATVFRQRLGLRSTDFSCKVQDGEIAITTRGYGHGVGMCQYGAAEMAGNGHDYREILEHYYSGAKVEEF